MGQLASRLSAVCVAHQALATTIRAKAFLSANSPQPLLWTPLEDPYDGRLARPVSAAPRAALRK